MTRNASPGAGMFPASASRREWLGQFATGLGGMALAALLAKETAGGSLPSEAADPPPHHPAKARRAIQIFLQGGLSQLESFDYKPKLAELHGKPVPGEEKPQGFMGKVGLLHKPHFAFHRRGESGLWVSDLFPRLAEVADELTVINSMWAGTGNHTPATYEANSGFRTLGFPAAGSWVSYGLGAEVDNLPTFVVFPDSRTWPTGRANNWSSGFLPARHQGVVLNTSGQPVRNLRPSSGLDDATQTARFEALAELNRRHLAERSGDDALESRMRSYELAARMQLAVPAATDLTQETAATRELYGVDRKECADFARACLLSRRLLEHGVRFIQLWSGGAFGMDVHWDAHGNVSDNHRREAGKIDQPVAALLKDLRQRGMLDDTLVVWSGEFGRTPWSQDLSGTQPLHKHGREHQPESFCAWLAGGGVRPGLTYGTTDDYGFKTVENAVHLHDLHATILHLLGFDHERLVYRHAGRDYRLTDVFGHVVKDIVNA